MKKSKTQKKISTKKKMKKLDLRGDDPLEQDLSEMMTQGQWVRFSDLFEFQPKNKTITLRVPETMLDNLKTIALKEKKDYQKLIREALAELIMKKMKKIA